MIEDYGPDFAKDRAAAVAWAKKVLADPNVLICDTETTGLGSTAEILDLAILAPDGTVLCDSRFLPTAAIEPGASRVHGWTLPKLLEAGAPRFAERWPEIAALLAGKVIVTYNAAFDQAVLAATCRRYALAGPAGVQFACAMERFAEYCGAWSSWHGSYTWQSLVTAAWEAKAPAPDHSALGDARACLAVVRWLAAQEVSE